jgi:hypothetical protein
LTLKDIEGLRSGLSERFARGLFAHASLLASAVPEPIYDSLTIDW